jgi:hypothetical protein
MHLNALIFTKSQQLIEKQLINGATNSVACLLRIQRQKMQGQAQAAMLRVIQNLIFLTAQGLPFHGHDDISSNFPQLLKLRLGDCAGLNVWLKSNQGAKYIAHYM